MKTSTHRTKKVAIKWIDIDVEMIPIVNWLNSYELIYTQYCCEGYGEDDEGWDFDNKGNINSCYRPYISYICIWSKNLSGEVYLKYKNIKQLLSKYADQDKGNEKSNSIDGRFTYYCWRFHSKEKMREFIKKEL